jgi:hypothetical protein
LPTIHAANERFYLATGTADPLASCARSRARQDHQERLLVATAASYVVSPNALGPIAVDPNREVDRLLR